MRGTVKAARRGSPLIVLAALTAGWVGARTVVWENPFAPIAAGVSPLLADGKSTLIPPATIMPQRGGGLATNFVTASPDLGAERDGGSLYRLSQIARSGSAFRPMGQTAGSSPYRIEPRVAIGHHMLLAAALSYLPGPESFRQAAANMTPAGQPPFAPPLLPAFTPYPAAAAKPDRWSLDAWAFWRQSSDATAISQSRVPIYGASQFGANLQFRLAPGSSHDPRAYGRAYRALVRNGETEVAAGLSARPLAGVPLRAQAELRITDNGFRTEARPAALVVTEFAPQRLPGGLIAEAYGQGGYVGGTNATAFADGQLSLTRQLTQFNLAQGQPARISVGAGAWAGAQKDATRVDLGPTVRLDLTIGTVPARLSVDWREQVAGDAAPDSGVAATLSTRF